MAIIKFINNKVSLRKTLDYICKEEKIGINIQEASEILGISKQLMAELTKLKDFPCIKFERRIVINKPKMIEWFDKNAGRIIV